MAYQGFTILAVVPARGGSKSIPRKNLCTVGGISLVGRAAKIAHSLEWVDRAILSTDDEEIAAEGKKFGLDVPFMRPAELASDTSTSIDMWRHAWLTSEKHYGCRFDISLLLEPTSPLRTPNDVERTVETLLSGDFDAAATISRAPAHFTPHKCLMVNEHGYIAFYLKDGAQYSVRQKIPAYYFRNGVCYAVKRKPLVDDGTLLEQRCGAVILERYVVNIDEPFELDLAEFILSRQQ